MGAYKAPLRSIDENFARPALNGCIDRRVAVKSFDIARPWISSALAKNKLNDFSFARPEFQRFFGGFVNIKSRMATSYVKTSHRYS